MFLPGGYEIVIKRVLLYPVRFAALALLTVWDSIVPRRIPPGLRDVVNETGRPLSFTYLPDQQVLIVRSPEIRRTPLRIFNPEE